MPDLTMLASNPYLQGNAAFARTPEQKRDAMSGAMAHTLIGLGSGISRAGMGDQTWMAGLAPGFEMGANAAIADQNRMFQQNLAGTQFQQQEAYRRAQGDALKSRASGSVEDLMKAARVTPTTVRAAEQGGHQAGHDDQMANRGLELWRQRNALQGNPYLQMGGP